MRKRVLCIRSVLLVGLCVLLTGCVSMNTRSGKAVSSLDGIQIGQTTRQQVLEKYGPPQVLDQGACSSAFGTNHLAYEERKGDGSFSVYPLVTVFKKTQISATTVFLFDEKGVLVDFAQGSAETGRTKSIAFLARQSTALLLK